MLFLQRKVYKSLKEHLNQPEISLILGPRQAGKTTLMQKLREDLTKQAIPSVYFNLDIIEDKQYFSTQHELLNKIESVVGHQKAVVFIDEVQRLDNAGLFLKGFFDLQTKHKLIVSGSGSLELKASIIEPMTGRKKVFYCLPFSFAEFCAYKLKVSFNRLPDLVQNNPQTSRLTTEYLKYGGYPRVILSNSHEEKIAILQEIFQSYLEKDIMLLLRIEKSEAFTNLVKVLAAQAGNLINFAGLAGNLGLNLKTLQKYLFYLEKTYIISLIRPFFTNVRKELRKSPKIYFLDLGFLRLAKGQLTQTLNEPSGDIWENACYLRLKELNLSNQIHFWRSTSGAEVDFILNSPKTGKPIPIEVKSAKMKKPVMGKSFISFLKKYHPSKAFIYTQNFSYTTTKLNIPVGYLPYYSLPKI